MGGSAATLSGSVSATTVSGHGASEPVAALSGTGAAGIQFGTSLSSGSYSVCSLQRYTGTPYGRVLQGGDGNWLHGHYSSTRGLGHYGTWMTSASTSHGTLTDWLVYCGTAASNGQQLANGMNVRSGSSTGGATSSLHVGGTGEHGGSQPSSWAFAELMIWNRNLDAYELRAASDYLMLKLGSRV